MRLRQTVLVARDLDAVVGDLTAVLGIEVGFNDPLVREFGLRNAVMPIGDTFLEVVSPIDPKATAQRYLERRRGDGGYMLILQCDDLDADRRRMADLGVRTVWKLDLPDIRGTHLHPKDTGGALLSLDDATPADSWHWAGPEWRRHVRRERSVPRARRASARAYKSWSSRHRGARAAPEPSGCRSRSSAGASRSCAVACDRWRASESVHASRPPSPPAARSSHGRGGGAR